MSTRTATTSADLLLLTISVGKASTAMRIRIVGAGAMGRGIAQWAASAGHTVELGDVRAAAVKDAVEFVVS
ncbi:3-hydroxyacyl-CoA dehydrogenase NAD-binding domain-containing protein, partial [Streptomyces halstedii]|uniref:3-hydroxyacyl-CoA dehydrogenase NAD-binding domain-containing protein n=1 Tax=Streptomyces halstedii TaxID=1944 RepID=UPI0033B4415F